MPWFRGDCHVHSFRSHGGELTPAQLTLAAHAAGLDFLTVTEHNTPIAYADWAVVAWSTAADFVRVEVRHPGGRMAALTNPVFLDLTLE